VVPRNSAGGGRLFRAGRKAAMNRETAGHRVFIERLVA
jgi:hypothetical protein